MEPQTKTKAGKPSLFRAYKNDANQLVVPAATITVHFTVELYDLLGEFNPVTWTFTAARTGYYFLMTQLSFLTAAASYNMVISFVVNGVPLAGQRKFDSAFNGTIQEQTMQVWHLNAGDTVTVQVTNGGAVNFSVLLSTNTWFAIRRMY